MVCLSWASVRASLEADHAAIISFNLPSASSDAVNPSEESCSARQEIRQGNIEYERIKIWIQLVTMIICKDFKTEKNIWIIIRMNCWIWLFSANLFIQVLFHWILW